MSAPIRVLVVDDSAVMRGIMARIIASQPDMAVAGLAADPMVAFERLRRSAADVITLDVEMPGMSGLEFLERLMPWRPMPVVMVSSLTAQGADTTIRALELGAVDFIPKPDFRGSADLDAYARDVADKIRAAAAAAPAARRGNPPGGVAGAPLERSCAPRRDTAAILVGASTGGVEAIRTLLHALPADMPPILAAQHMPVGFTASFARRLDASCDMAVKEAEDGEALSRGAAYIAPGGTHLRVDARGGTLRARISTEPPIERHRPSIDALFRSAAESLGARCIGVMLSGMGADGARAMLELRRRGAHTIAQDQASCVVFGMPKQAIALGAVEEVLAPRDIARRLAGLCSPTVAAG